MTAIPATIDALRARVTEKGPWFTVPADAQPTRCRSCGAAIYFVQQPSGKLMPIDVLVPGGQVPRRGGPAIDDRGIEWGVPAGEGRGVSHFATCPSAAQHRRRS